MQSQGTSYSNHYSKYSPYSISNITPTPVLQQARRKESQNPFQEPYQSNLSYSIVERKSPQHMASHPLLHFNPMATSITNDNNNQSPHRAFQSNAMEYPSNFRNQSPQYFKTQPQQVFSKTSQVQFLPTNTADHHLYSMNEREKIPIPRYRVLQLPQLNTNKISMNPTSQPVYQNYFIPAQITQPQCDPNRPHRYHFLPPQMPPNLHNHLHTEQNEDVDLNDNIPQQSSIKKSSFINKNINYDLQYDKIDCIVCGQSYSIKDQENHKQIHRKRFEKQMGCSLKNPIKNLSKYQYQMNPHSLVKGERKKFSTQRMQSGKGILSKPIVQPEQYNVQYDPNEIIVEKDVQYRKKKDGRIVSYSQDGVGTSGDLIYSFPAKQRESTVNYVQPVFNPSATSKNLKKNQSTQPSFIMKNQQQTITYQTGNNLNFKPTSTTNLNAKSIEPIAEKQQEQVQFQSQRKMLSDKKESNNDISSKYQIKVNQPKAQQQTLRPNSLIQKEIKMQSPAKGYQSYQPVNSTKSQTQLQLRSQNSSNKQKSKQVVRIGDPASQQIFNFNYNTNNVKPNLNAKNQTKIESPNQNTQSYQPNQESPTRRSQPQPESPTRRSQPQNSSKSYQPKQTVQFGEPASQQIFNVNQNTNNVKPKYQSKNEMKLESPSKNYQSFQSGTPIRQSQPQSLNPTKVLYQPQNQIRKYQPTQVVQIGDLASQQIFDSNYNTNNLKNGMKRRMKQPGELSSQKSIPKQISEVNQAKKQQPIIVSYDLVTETMNAHPYRAGQMKRKLKQQKQSPSKLLDLNSKIVQQNQEPMSFVQQNKNYYQSRNAKSTNQRFQRETVTPDKNYQTPFGQSRESEIPRQTFKNNSIQKDRQNSQPFYQQQVFNFKQVPSPIQNYRNSNNNYQSSPAQKPHLQEINFNEIINQKNPQQQIKNFSQIERQSQNAKQSQNLASTSNFKKFVIQNNQQNQFQNSNKKSGDLNIFDSREKSNFQNGLLGNESVAKPMKKKKIAKNAMLVWN